MKMALAGKWQGIFGNIGWWWGKHFRQIFGTRVYNSINMNGKWMVGSLRALGLVIIWWEWLDRIIRSRLLSCSKAMCCDESVVQARPSRQHSVPGWMVWGHRDGGTPGPSRESICWKPIWCPAKQGRQHVWQWKAFKSQRIIYNLVRRSPSPLLSKLYQNRASYLLGRITVFKSVKTFKIDFIWKIGVGMQKKQTVNPPFSGCVK